MAAAWPLLTEDEAGRIAGAFEAFEAEERAEYYTDGKEGPYASWFFSLKSGKSRIPEMTPEATRATLLAWLVDTADDGPGGATVTCDACGLARGLRRIAILEPRRRQRRTFGPAAERPERTGGPVPQLLVRGVHLGHAFARRRARVGGA